MAFSIVWSKTASDTLHNLTEFLAESWNEKVIVRFIDKVYKSVEMVENFPELRRIYDLQKGIRVLLIQPYTNLFYRIDGFNVVLIEFVGTRTDPESNN